MHTFTHIKDPCTLELKISVQKRFCPSRSCAPHNLTQVLLFFSMHTQASTPAHQGWPEPYIYDIFGDFPCQKYRIYTVYIHCKYIIYYMALNVCMVIQYVYASGHWPHTHTHTHIHTHTHTHTHTHNTHTGQPCCSYRPYKPTYAQTCTPVADRHHTVAQVVLIFSTHHTPACNHATGLGERANVRTYQTKTLVRCLVLFVCVCVLSHLHRI